ncbi:MAG: DNA methylase, partial [Chloroflexi bacterium CG07_land_8_20_14_0_80_51_10]
MREVIEQEYQEFIKGHDRIVVDGSAVKLIDGSQIELLEPKEFSLEKTTVWSFENRGKWATHRGNYRGNWAPEIPRNLILRYTQPGDLVLDQMVGSGTTLVECKLLGRSSIGIDLNLDAVMVAWNRTNFAYNTNGLPETTQRIYCGDARRLELIDDESIDL